MGINVKIKLGRCNNALDYIPHKHQVVLAQRMCVHTVLTSGLQRGETIQIDDKKCDGYSSSDGHRCNGWLRDDTNQCPSNAQSKTIQSYIRRVPGATWSPPVCWSYCRRLQWLIVENTRVIIVLVANTVRAGSSEKKNKKKSQPRMQHAIATRMPHVLVSRWPPSTQWERVTSPVFFG